MDFKNVKVVLSEIDGIVTEHLAGIGEFNVTMFKQFNMKDLEAINMIKQDWPFAFMSSDAAINASFCRKRNLPFFFAERSKSDVYGQVLRRYSVSANEILYIGSTYSDIPCLRMSGFSMCPEDSPPSVKNICDVVLPIYSGAGVLCYVYEMLHEFKVNYREE